MAAVAFSSCAANTLVSILIIGWPTWIICPDSKKILLEEKRIENMNNRVEATQTINPITGL